jgi:hypothetical protein
LPCIMRKFLFGTPFDPARAPIWPMIIVVSLVFRRRFLRLGLCVEIDRTVYNTHPLAK